MVLIQAPPPLLARGLPAHQLAGIETAKKGGRMLFPPPSLPSLTSSGPDLDLIWVGRIGNGLGLENDPGRWKGARERSWHMQRRQRLTEGEDLEGEDGPWKQMSQDLLSLWPYPD